MRYKHFTTSIFALALAGAVQAAELGDVAPRSYIGQPLAVDIDLVSLTPEEMNGLQVRLAAQDVYRGANVTMNPALASVRMQVERRGGKPVLHVTTARAVEADYLHLYVELGVPGKQEVRLATVWLQRDPNPPAPPAPVAPAVPLASAMTPAQAEQITSQARAARAAAAGKPAASGAPAGPGAAPAAVTTTTAATASAAGATAAAAPVRERGKPAPLPSVHEAETGAPGEVKAAGQARRIAGVLVSPDGKPLKPSAREDSAEVPVGVSQALLPLAPLPLPKGVKRPASASCPAGGISAKECVALDNHNAEISTKLTELEGKLKTLQGALGGAAPATKSATPAAAHGDGAANAASAKAAAAGAAAIGAAKPLTSAAAEKTVATAPAPVAAGKSGAAGEAPPAAAKSSSAGGAGHGAASASSAGTQGGKAAQLSASMAAPGETEMHAAKAAVGEGGAAASASASAGDAAASASVPTKQVRVLPKLKYKKEKEKPVEQTSSTWPLIAGGAGLLALLGGGFFFWRKKNAGRGPLKIWQGFRKKKVEDPMEEFKPVPEPATASSSS